MFYFSIFFVYLYYPMKFERKFLKGPPPPAEKKIGPPPLGFWSSPTYDHVTLLWLLGFSKYKQQKKSRLEKTYVSECRGIVLKKKRDGTILKLGGMV